MLLATPRLGPGVRLRRPQVSDDEPEDAGADQTARHPRPRPPSPQAHLPGRVATKLFFLSFTKCESGGEIKPINFKIFIQVLQYFIMRLHWDDTTLDFNPVSRNFAIF